MNILKHRNRIDDTSTFGVEKQKRTLPKLPVSIDVIVFFVSVSVLIGLYFGLQQWYNTAVSEFEALETEYSSIESSIQGSEFLEATAYVRKANELVRILGDSYSFIPIINRLTDSIHNNVVLEKITIAVEDGIITIDVIANGTDVSYRQQDFVWQNNISSDDPWITESELQSYEPDKEIVEFRTQIKSHLSFMRERDIGQIDVFWFIKDRSGDVEGV